MRAGLIALLLALPAASRAGEVVIAERASVRGPSDDWQGPADLSFRYRVSAADGVLHVDIDVTDDHVVWGGPGADHIAVSIADAALVADAEVARRAVDERRQEVETLLADEAHEPAEVKDVAAELADAVQRWRDDERTLAATVTSSARMPAAAPASSRCEITPRGYHAALTIPLAGVLSPTSATVAAIRYLIEVHDVDRDDAAGVETVMASSTPVDAVIAPSQLALLLLPRPWRLRLDGEQRIAHELAPGGRFELRDGTYRYVLPHYGSTGWTFEGACCTPNITLPGWWQPFEPQDVSRLPGTRLYVGADAVLFIAGGRRARLNVADAEPLFQARRGGAYYLVFVENDPLRQRGVATWAGEDGAGGDAVTGRWSMTLPSARRSR